MDRIGQVVQIHGKTATVKVRRAASCEENCALCSEKCTPTPTNIKAVNGLNAKVGDMVKVEMNRGVFFMLTFIGYILPAVIAATVYLAAYKLTADSLAADICAVAALIAVIAVSFAADKLPVKSTRFSNRIIRILR